MPTAAEVIKDTIQTPEALKTALVDATTNYIASRTTKDATTTPDKAGIYHGESGLLRAQCIKESAEAEENKADLVALFALLYVAMSPYTPFGPIDALDACTRSKWLANALAETMITGEFYEFNLFCNAENNAKIDTLNSTVFTEKFLKDSKENDNIIHTSASQAHVDIRYSKQDALRFGLLNARKQMTGKDRSHFDAKVKLFNAASKETDKAREDAKRAKKPQEENSATEMSNWELRVLALQR